MQKRGADKGVRTKGCRQKGQLRIGCVINLCAERIHPNSPYAHVPGELAKQGIDQTILEANDSHDFDIIPVAEAAVGHIKARLTSAQKSNVLIHCWGGVNRSAAVAAFYLMTELGVPLFDAINQLMQVRGTVLTNQSFRKQLVHYCFQQGLKFIGNAVPVYIQTASSRRAIQWRPSGTGTATSGTAAKSVHAGIRDSGGDLDDAPTCLDDAAAET